MHAKFEIVGES